MLYLNFLRPVYIGLIIITLGRVIPVLIFYLLIGLAKINSFILWQVNKRTINLHQLTFRIVLARQLTEGYSSRKKKGRSARFQAKKCVDPDNVRLASVRNHMPPKDGSYAGAVVGMPLSGILTDYISWQACFYAYVWAVAGLFGRQGYEVLRHPPYSRDFRIKVKSQELKMK
ncbi:piggyBac transposable element-derived protein 4 [Trichonephila clavipes]|nr:piggyBac transposable element-derived protein 4 [Trichonephila clavipes]